MAFGKPGFKKGGYAAKGKFAKKSTGKAYDNTKITGLWKTKRPGLYVGTANELDDIIALVKKARAAGKGITFFLWKNDNEDFNQAFNLVAAVAQDAPQSIKDEDEEQPEEEEGGDDL